MNEENQEASPSQEDSDAGAPGSSSDQPPTENQVSLAAPLSSLC